MLRLWLLSVSLVLTAWLINSHLPPRQPPLLNYDHTVYFDPVKVRSPSTREEIVSVVSEAVESGRSIRVLGAGHSRSGIALSDDIIVSMHKYTGVFKFDQQARLVTVRAGTTIGEVVEYLSERGLALPSLPAITEQTVAGAISTGTHGTGMEFGNLATMVTGLELVTGEGETLSLSETNHPSVFKAALVSVGLLGIITKVTLQCVPAFLLEESLRPLSLDQCMEQLSTVATSAEHVKLWTELYSQTCMVIGLNRTEKGKTEGDLSALDWKLRLMEPFLFLSSWLPSHTPSIMRFVANYIDVHLYPYRSRVDAAHRVFAPPTLYFPSNQQTEVAVDMTKCKNAITLLRNMVTEKQIPANLITEIRFVQRDDIWLSPSYQRDGCYITLLLYNPSTSTVESHFDGFYRELVKQGFSPRVHFGKYFTVEPQEMHNTYPQLPSFMEIRERLDPNGVFLNQLVRRTFGL